MQKMNLQETNSTVEKTKAEKQVDEVQEMLENQNLSATNNAVDKTVNTERKDQMNKKTKKAFIMICVVASIAGVLTGFGANKLKSKTASNKDVELNAVAEDPNKISIGDIFGVQDESTFTDNTQGYVEKGGVNGEGSHRLLREGGTDKTVALTSSVTDLDQFVGMEIKIWGETNKAQQSGWFMDVGRVEVVDTDAEAPIQELE
jgi:hypothetical protein